MEPAHHRYYRSMHGAWSARFDLRVADREALRAAALTWRERATVHALLALVRVAPLVMRTTLDWTTSGERGLVLHTTRLSLGPIPLFLSVDDLHLLPDGRSVRLAGWRGEGPLFLRVPQEGSVTVDEDGLGAVYDLPWYGGRMIQETRVVPEGLRLVQRSAWSAGEIVLVRRSDRV